MTTHFKPGELTFALLPWTGCAGHEPRSAYVELFWTPSLGPTGTALWPRLVEALAYPQPVDVAELFHEVGVRQQAVMRTTLDRMGRYRLLSRLGRDVLRIAERAPTLYPTSVENLPPRLRAIHDQFVVTCPSLGEAGGRVAS